MSRIFLHIKYGCGMAFVPIFQEEGHEVITFIDEKDYRNNYDGMCKKIDNINTWVNMITPKDYAFFDFTGSGNIGEYLRSRRIPVFGGQLIADRMEKDRVFGMNLMAYNGIKIPPTVSFTRKSEGIAFLKKNGGRYVYKPCGEGASCETYVADGPEDMISFINEEPEQPYILQTFIPGIELATAVYFAQGNPMTPAYHTIETKKLMPGDVGPNTGAMSSCVWFTKDLNNKAIKEGIGKMFPYLKKIKYTGTLDLNSIVDEKGQMYGLEWTPRMGYGCEYALREIINEPFSELLSFCADGEEDGYIPVDENNYGLGLRIGVPPYPLEANPNTEKAVDVIFKDIQGTKIVMKPSRYTYNLLNVMKKGPDIVTAGGDGIVMEIDGKGKDLEKEQESIVECAKKNITLENKIYRIDPFDRAIEQIPKIKKMGFDTI